MKTNSLSYLLTYPVLCIILVACSPSPDKKGQASQGIKVSHLGQVQEPIYQIDHEGILFQSTMGDTFEFGEGFKTDIEYELTNSTHREVFYLEESCNGLDYFLQTHPFQVVPFNMCNYTVPIVSILKPGESLKGKTQLLAKKGVPSLEKIGIDVRRLSRFIPIDTLKKYPNMLDHVYHTQADPDNIIWSKLQVSP
ncbi:MAG: hypothetical protein AAFY71_10460 [Bacteroidota bacterium]